MVLGGKMNLYEPIKRIIIPVAASSLSLLAGNVLADFNPYFYGNLGFDPRIGSFTETTQYPDAFVDGKTNELKDTAKETVLRGELEAGVCTFDILKKTRLGLYINEEQSSVSAKRTFENTELGTLKASSLDGIIGVILGGDFDIGSIGNSLAVGFGTHSFGRNVNGPYGEMIISNTTNADSGTALFGKYGLSVWKVKLNADYFQGNSKGTSTSSISIPAFDIKDSKQSPEEFKRKYQKLMFDLGLPFNLHLLAELFNSVETTGKSEFKAAYTNLGGAFILPIRELPGLNLGLGYLKSNGSTSSDSTSSNSNGQYVLFVLKYAANEKPEIVQTTSNEQTIQNPKEEELTIEEEPTKKQTPKKSTVGKSTKTAKKASKTKAGTKAKQ